MYDPIRQPCHDIQKSVLVCREYIAKVCTVEDVLKGWEDFDPDRWPPCTRDESARKSQLRSEDAHFLGISGSAWNGGNLPARIEKYEPCSYREEREEELACDRKDEGEE